MAAELSKRGIPNALLSENFSDDDLIAGTKDGERLCFIQVKSCHPDRANTFILRETDEKWKDTPENQFVVFVWLGSHQKNESPKFWITTKKVVGLACMKHPAHGTGNWERRFSPKQFPDEWENNWPEIVRSFAYLTKVCHLRIRGNSGSQVDYLVICQKIRNVIIHSAELLFEVVFGELDKKMKNAQP